MTEAMARPETFTAPDLLVNTGLLLVDLRAPWVEEICFTVTDRIQKLEDGSYAVHVLGEDYGFHSKPAGSAFRCGRHGRST